MLTVGGIVGGLTGSIRASSAILVTLVVFVFISMIFYAVLTVEELQPGPLPPSAYVPFTAIVALFFSALLGEVLFDITGIAWQGFLIVGVGTVVLTWALLFQYYYEKFMRRFRRSPRAPIS